MKDQFLPDQGRGMVGALGDLGSGQGFEGGLGIDECVSHAYASGSLWSKEKYYARKKTQRSHYIYERGV